VVGAGLVVGFLPVSVRVLIDTDFSVWFFPTFSLHGPQVPMDHIRRGDVPTTSEACRRMCMVV